MKYILIFKDQFYKQRKIIIENHYRPQEKLHF